MGYFKLITDSVVGSLNVYGSKHLQVHVVIEGIIAHIIHSPFAYINCFWFIPILA